MLTLLRANPPKGGDAELRGYRDKASPCQPGRQRTEFGVLAAFFFWEDQEE